jgi:hypothetical protein
MVNPKKLPTKTKSSTYRPKKGRERETKKESLSKERKKEEADGQSKETSYHNKIFNIFRIRLRIPEPAMKMI